MIIIIVVVVVAFTALAARTLCSARQLTNLLLVLLRPV
jgi:hypothetical protein